MEAVGEVVEIGEAGGHAGHLAAAGMDGLDLVQRGFHEDRQRLVVLAGLAFGDGVHLGLGAIHQIRGVAFAGVAHLGDLDRGFDEATQDGLVLDDGGVVARVRGHGDRCQEVVQVRVAADAGDLASLDEFLGHGDGVGGLAAAV